MKVPKPKPFFLVVQDRSANTCNIFGPILDDRPLMERVIEAQKRGKDVNCTADRESETMQEAIDVARRRGFSCTAEDVLR